VGGGGGGGVGGMSNHWGVGGGERPNGEGPARESLPGIRSTKQEDDKRTQGLWTARGGTKIERGRVIQLTRAVNQEIGTWWVHRSGREAALEVSRPEREGIRKKGGLGEGREKRRKTGEAFQLESKPPHVGQRRKNCNQKTRDKPGQV